MYKGLEVSLRVSLIDSRSFSGEPGVNPVKIPNPPAFETAATNLGNPTHLHSHLNLLISALKGEERRGRGGFLGYVGEMKGRGGERLTSYHLVRLGFQYLMIQSGKF